MTVSTQNKFVRKCNISKYKSHCIDLVIMSSFNNPFLVNGLEDKSAAFVKALDEWINSLLDNRELTDKPKPDDEDVRKSNAKLNSCKEKFLNMVREFE